MQETQKMQVKSLGWEGPLEKRMAAHSSILAGKIPWTEEPGRLWDHKELDTTDHTQQIWLLLRPNFSPPENSCVCYVSSNCFLKAVQSEFLFLDSSAGSSSTWLPNFPIPSKVSRYQTLFKGHLENLQGRMKILSSTSLQSILFASLMVDITM